MAHGLASPVGLLSDEEAVTPPVLESTGAECGTALCRALLPDFSVIPSSHEQAAAEDSEKLKVYARVRPLKLMKMAKQEDQGCVCIKDSENLLLKAPKDSFTMKNAERGVGQAVHKFTFTKIFGPEVGQKSFFDATMKDVVKDVLNGQNWLIYTYGVTNSGKTYTIQGTATDVGILPRSLAIIFNSIGTRLYPTTDLKPFLSSEVMWLDSKQVRQEEAKKQALMCAVMKEEEPLASWSKGHSTASHSHATTSTSVDSGIGGISSSCQFASQTNSSQMEETGLYWADSDTVSVLAQEEVQFSIWVSFFEIYNELIYDLLETTALGPNRKRPALRLCEDQTGNPYVKDLNWINIQDVDEAWKLLKLGRRNQSFASTHLNQNSSRSHTIFSIRILHLQKNSGEIVPKISELSLCDLAGSERCKDQKAGDRMKEANNINTSLHTLGRCLTLLRQNQQSRLKKGVVPFRDSKLTRMFQTFFTGHGQSCMIVNINPCASAYDETLHVAKFSAIASQLVQVPTKVGVPSIQSLIKEYSSGTAKAPGAVSDQELEPNEGSEDEADVTTYDKEDLLCVVKAVQKLLLKERREKFHLEMRLREEICNEMTEYLQQNEQRSREHLDAQRELLEDLYEGKMNILKESLTDYYEEQIESQNEQMKNLEAALQEAKLQLEQQQGPEETLRRSKRVAVTASAQQQERSQLQQQAPEETLRRSKQVGVTQEQELVELKSKLEQCQAELSTATDELHKYRKMLEPPPSAKPITADVDRKLVEGQKSVRLLRTELQKLGELFQSAERACCHSTSAGRLRETLLKCDDILMKQDQTLAELQNNMMLVKLDIRKKASCIAEQYQTVQKLQAVPTTSAKKRFCVNNENALPRSQPPVKKPFLHNFLTRSVAQPAVATESPYSRILRARASPTFKALTFGKKR